MDNPLLSMRGLPPFSQIKPEHVEPTIDHVLAQCRAELDRLLDANQLYSWENLLQPLEEMEDWLNRVWSPVSHMNSVVNSESWRNAYNACLPKLSDYGTEMGQNERLYRAFESIASSEQFAQLSPAQRKSVENGLRDFRLSGVALSVADKARFKALVQELSTTGSKFSENVLDATDAWKEHVTDIKSLDGLPSTALAMAKQAAEREKLDGWLLTLEFPCYLAVMTYATDRELRARMYEAYVTRASDQGPNDAKWDNTPLIERTLALRHDKARLLGYDNYAEYSLATKMATSAEQVVQFLRNLATKSLPYAKKDLDELRAFAKEFGQSDALEAWDVLYFSEKLREHRYSISDEALKPYFPEDRVLNGMFRLVDQIYGMRIDERVNVDTWHDDVRFFEIFDRNGQLRGQFYLDLYARPHKRGGAWMDDCMGRRRNAQGVQTPVAYLTCNFSPRAGSDPALLTHDEVLTLFHEFGHGLHHMLTQVDYLSVAGISGVPWDAVELPSQFMENWCWQREVVDMISGHYQTDAPLPDDMFKKMIDAKNFQAGMQMVRQLEFALFDFRLHAEYDPERGSNVLNLLAEVRSEVAVMHPPSFNRFPHSFSHIFAGGYAAGYYSYKWAEVLSADVYSLFEEKQVSGDTATHAETGERFRKEILAVGGSRPALESFIAFRGREPNLDALLRHNGMSVS